MPASLIQPSFAKGEISPALYGRVDTAAYQVALRKARNIIIQPYGGASNRTGLQFLGPCKKHTTTVRLIPFEFKSSDRYVLEFGDLYMRVIRDDAYVTETALTGCTATAANPVVVTKTAHGLSNGDEVLLSGFTEMTEVNSRRFIVADKTNDTFELTHQVTGADIDGTAWDAETTGGSVAKIYEIATPYDEADLMQLKYVQSADVMTLTHTGYGIRELTRTGHAAWTLTEPTFAPDQDHPTGMTLTVDGANNSVTYRYQVTAISSETQEESLPALNNSGTTPESATAADPVVVTDTSHGYANGDEIEINGFVEMTEVNGRRFTLANVTTHTYELEGEDGSGYTAESTGGTANLTWVKTTAGTTNPDNTVAWTAVTGAGRYAVYRDDNGLFGLVGETENTSFKDSNIDADLTITPPKSRDPFRGTNNKPGTVSYYEQRRIFGGTTDKPDTWYASQTGNQSNFSISDPLQQDDAMTVTLNALRVNDIRHFVPFNDLIILTSGSEWKVNSGSDVAFATDTIRQKPQSYWGSSHVRPLVIGNVILFVQESGTNVRSLGFSLTLDGYTGNDMNLLSSHMLQEFNKTIVDWASVHERSLVGAVRSDGDVLSLTFQPEQEVIAWATWDTDGKFKSVCSSSAASDLNNESLYFVVSRTIDGNTVQYVEKLKPPTHLQDDVKDAFYVDSGLSLDSPTAITAISLGATTTITAASHGLSDGDEVDISDIVWVADFDSFDNESQPSQLNGYRYTVASATTDTFRITTSAGADIDSSAYNAYVEDGNVRKAVLTVSGLDHLEGESVVALADGNFIDSLTVTNGSLTLSRKASRIHIGLQYFSDIETLDIEAPRGTMQDKLAKVISATVKFHKSRGLFIGYASDDLVEMKQREFELMGEPTRMLTGEKKINLPPKWNSNGRIFLRQRYPLPMNILAIIPELEVGD